MLSEETQERLADYLVNKIQESNTFILEKIGKTIKTMSTLKPSEAYKLQQILKYGGSYEEIAQQLAKVSGKNVQDIYKIFEEVARQDKEFAKQFYKYRGIDYIPYSKDIALKNQVESIARLTASSYLNISNTTGIGFLFKDLNGQMQFKNIQQSYYEIIDRGILAISQGKETFDTEMRNMMKQLGNKGIVLYENGHTRRLDSAIRMNLLDGIRQLHNETSLRFGAEYDADGVEISVHSNPAPDHADIQGRQFSNEEYLILENGGVAKDVKGREYNGAEKRHISEYNCYHTIFPIVIGVSEPEYTDKQLKEIQDKNNEGFVYEGKHYTNYEGTQLQRRLETEIRKKKDTQILARSAGDNELAQASELKIRQLTNKYNELSRVSNLMPQKQRMSVSGYRRIKTKDVKNNIKLEIVEKPKIDLNEEFYTLSADLENKDVNISNSIFNWEDKELRNEQLRQLDILTDKYSHNYNTNRALGVLSKNKEGNAYASTSFSGHGIYLYENHFINKENVIKAEKWNMERNWHYKVPEDKISIYSLTHEYGHILEHEWLVTKTHGLNTKSILRSFDKELKDTLVDRAIRKSKTKMTKTEFYNKFFSRYAKSKRNYEWFAETFAKYQLDNEKNIWVETFGEWLEGYFNGK